jgi:hypothetical protein
MPALSNSANRFLRSYVIPGLVLIGIVVAWDFTKPRVPKYEPEPPRQAEDRPNGGVPPWNAHEDLFQNGRDSARNTALRGLEQAWSTFCDPKGREKNVSAITYYFEQRRNQEESYPKRWGQEGRDYITAQWSAPNDARIERLIEELFGRGYLHLDDFRSYIAERIAPLVQNTRVIDQPCKR